MSNRIKESNITPGAVTSDKIAPGTISASNITPGTITGTQIATDTIASSNIAPGTIANDRLANTGITINGTTIALGASGDIVAGTDWQSVVVADGSTGTTASAGEGYFIDTTSAAHTITLPADGSSTIGDTIIIRDYAGTFATNNVTLTSTAKISGADADGTLSTNDLVVTLVYVDSTKGWVTIENEAKAIGAEDAAYVAATGGTVTESGDYKIHTFTGDGCFVVSCAGNVNPTGGSDTVDYLVVAGGGGAAYYYGGGGGAGGYRESSGTASGCYTVSPLGACVAALPVSATTYPVTVGAGGASFVNPGSPPYASPDGTNGSNSVFSTITSTGGGAGRGGISTSRAGFAGGSGGGAGGDSTGQPGGAGNTPPVSPPQGQPGGPDTIGNAGMGGGGAGGAGSGKQAGSGVASSINGSSTYRAGGGNGGPAGGESTTNARTTYANAGAANSGSGAGGDHNGVGGAGGGKGIVIIRYKFQ